MTFRSIGVMGGGAWGTALAHRLALNGRSVLIWAFEPETVDAINTHHTNPLFLADIPLSHALRATSDLSALSACELVLLVPPAQHLGRLAGELVHHVSRDVPFVICAKGIERETNRLLQDVLAATAPHQPFAFLSGPSFASEVAKGLPAALTVACPDADLGRKIAETIGSPNLRLYWTDDVVGVAIGGAAKNVLAIAAGIVDGRALGANAHAALVTRGFAELRRFAEAHGARAETLAGLSGLGDLLLTCGSPQSRNMSLGRALGQGQSIEDVLGARTSVTEGVYTAAAMVAMAEAKGIDVPISRAVLAIVEGHIGVDAAIEALMQRPLKAED
ncbi:MAG: NAD(P)H-dependent glycerol-3-phosphate dehydrogenase [Pseudomonadota bacterium]